MLTGELKSKIDRIWDAFWSGGISNAAVLADSASLDEELKRLRSEVAEAKKAAVAKPDTHDYSEAETRDYFIDLLTGSSPRDRSMNWWPCWSR